MQVFVDDAVLVPDRKGLGMTNFRLLKLKEIKIDQRNKKIKNSCREIFSKQNYQLVKASITRTAVCTTSLGQ